MAANLRLEGKVAIITGGASGIGEAAVRLFAAHGAVVVIADIQDTLGHSVAASIPPPGRCTYVHCDVRDELQVAAAVKHAVETHGRLDVMLSNAGVLGALTGVLNLDMADFNELMAVHIFGTAAAIKHAGLAMVSAGTRGSIICTASVAALQGGLGTAAYTAVKHAVVGLAKSAAGELGEKGVRVNCVSPFGVATPMNTGTGKMSAEKIEELVSAVAPIKGPVLRARDVAAAALFLASDESAFINGHNLVIDGGVAAAVKYAVETHGRLDVMFSNAGVLGPLTGILDLDMDGLDELLAVHIRGTAAAIKHAGRAMTSAGIRGSIICTAGVAAVYGGFVTAAYTAAKHALVGLAKSAAGELGEKGVRVNCVSPFGVATPMNSGAGKLSAEKIEKFTSAASPIKGPVLKAADVAAAALFLASDESAFVNGHNLLIDGGVTTVNCSLTKVLRQSGN